MFPLVPGLVGLYLVWRYISRLQIGLGARWLLSAVLLVFIEHHWLVSRVFGTIASPEIPRAAIMVLATVFGALMMLACLLLIRDVAGVLQWLLTRHAGLLRRRPGPWAHGLALVCLALSGIGVWQGTGQPQLRHEELAIPGLAPAFDGYRVAHLTDLHTSRLLPGPWLAQVVERTNAARPDVIVISGDLVDGTPEARAQDYPALAGLAAPDGVFGVTGNHDYYQGYPQWLDVFGQQGVRMLMNEHVVLRRGPSALVVAGVTDQVAPTRDAPGPDVVQALAGRPAHAPVLLLDHRPGAARANRAAGADLQLSGHTHGGHILGMDRLVARFNGGFVSGLYGVDGGQLYVSNGAGLWPGFPLRLGRPSEITVFTLREAP
ncbi:metallophosphoesterase [Bordetella genomosp. 12]|uniref:metallophosphoesterase n=1 Tax=Bordetella genomosp. 12 TaxID=463035 RepID=UPI001ABFD15C|nr:metallophosphoesterase [Bordetella genomosp. 12]